MPELLVELFSEEIPARMQARAADDLARLVADALAPLAPSGIRTFSGPRRIALRAEIAEAVPGSEAEERGPRIGAPAQALAGFLRKHGAAREDLAEAGGHWVLRRRVEAMPAAELVARVMPPLLWRFPWPKSMRWGSDSQFTWVRPLRRILCLLDGTVVPFTLAQGGDPAHHLRSGDTTEGHRFHAPGAFTVTSVTAWQDGLRARRVLADADERRRLIAEGIAALAASEGLSVVPDDGLLDEVAGLVEWPVPLLGRIDEAFMDLPPEVMQVSMRANQRYFALRRADGSAAPRFAFAANVEAEDGGGAIVAGNERVLRARFSDARHFWDLDRRTKLADRVAALDGVTFHAKLGSQGERARRIELLAGEIASKIGADPDLARRAGRLAKADLTTGMVGEFPELQGVMGGYYARHDGEPEEVADAIRLQYTLDKIPGRSPATQVALAVALADRLDQLVAFFSIGEQPTGSSDPYALRRAALGVVGLILSAGLQLPLRPLLGFAGMALPPVSTDEVFAFIVDRLRFQMRTVRQDILNAVLTKTRESNLRQLFERAQFLEGFVGGSWGRGLLTTFHRAANILRIEEKKDGPISDAPNPALYIQDEERELAAALDRALAGLDAQLKRGHYKGALDALDPIRAPLDAFFEHVTVNAPEPDLRRNRLCLLHRVRAAMDQVADFSKIEG